MLINRGNSWDLWATEELANIIQSDKWKACLYYYLCKRSLLIEPDYDSDEEINAYPDFKSVSTDHLLEIASNIRETITDSNISKILTNPLSETDLTVLEKKLEVLCNTNNESETRVTDQIQSIDLTNSPQVAEIIDLNETPKRSYDFEVLFLGALVFCGYQLTQQKRSCFFIDMIIVLGGALLKYELSSDIKRSAQGNENIFSKATDAAFTVTVMMAIAKILEQEANLLLDGMNTFPDLEEQIS